MARGVVSWGVLGVGEGVTGVAGCLAEAIFLLLGISSSVETNQTEHTRFSNLSCVTITTTYTLVQIIVPCLLSTCIIFDRLNIRAFMSYK